MAQIVRKASSLSDEHQRYRNRAVIGGIISGAIMNGEQRLSPEIVNRIALLLNNQTR
ncbi:MAG: hypothetical protein IJC46_06460 [Clostridia bacterium]|nr:hypothetical protein [Clostridia bacterium]